MHSPDESLRRYNEKDRAMRSALPVPEVQAFSTRTFDSIGWPHSVERAADLIRYADWCNHPGANDYFADNAVLPTQCASLQFSVAEIELLRKVEDGVGAFTRSLGHEVRPVLNHLAQIGPFRIIMEIRKRLGLDRLTVFDVGAGSGYQAALQVLGGNRTLLTDNAQGLYLFQSQLLRTCSAGDVRDWADDGPPNGPVSERVQMIPWWDYLGLRKSSMRDVDVFFCNNNLGEMNYAAAAYTTFLAKRLMADSPVKMFFFTCLGTPNFSNPERIDQLLQRAGFVNVVRSPFWLYTLKGHRLPEGLFDFVNDIPVWQMRRGERLRTAREITRFRPEQLPTDLDFVSFTGVFDLAKALASPPAAPDEEPAPPQAEADKPPQAEAGNLSTSARAIVRRLVNGIRG